MKRRILAFLAVTVLAFSALSVVAHAGPIGISPTSACPGTGGGGTPPPPPGGGGGGGGYNTKG